MKARKNLSQLWLPAIRVVQIILSIAVIVFILLQARGAGLGSVFGGSSAGTVFKTRRGVEKLIFNLTIVFVVLFAVVSLLAFREVGWNLCAQNLLWCTPQCCHSPNIYLFL
jgi:preprotein translocase subunit SecG